jgi:glycosyltransferase involved in cell wall biosynthesis
MENQPLVSVIVPCYNQAEFLPEALDCVRAQTYQNWECVIINDGSPDSAEAVAQPYLAKDARFKYLRQENQGPSAARNSGIRHSSGKYILPLDADDRVGSEYLSEAVAALEQDSELKLVYSRVNFFGENHGEWKLPDYSPSELLVRNMIFNSAIFRRTDFDRVGGYDENFRDGHEDWEFWISLLCPAGKVLKLPEIHFFYRIRDCSRQHTLSGKEAIACGLKFYEKHKDIYLRFWGSPQKYLVENLRLKEDWAALMKSPRMKLANLLFMPVDLIREFCKKLNL